MRSRNVDRRFGEIIVGLFLLLAGLSALGSGQTILLILGVIGFVLLARQFAGTMQGMNRADHQPEYEDDLDVLPAQPRPDQVYAHALDAVRHAQLDPAETHVLPVDIGVMAVHGTDEPVIHRTRPVLDDADYLQPFVQLRLPTRAHGRIRFEIADADGKLVFVHEQDKDFERGRNLVIPPARLPLQEVSVLHDEWHLRVSADGVLIADHTFGWSESTNSVIRRHVQEDGELSGEIRELMTENNLEERVSLDDLLSEQESSPSQQSSRR